VAIKKYFRKELAAQTLDLEKYDIHKDELLNDNKYISIEGLPSTLSYGKHYFSLTYHNPPHTNQKLKFGTKILFELKDLDGNYIYSDVTAYKAKGRSVLCYIDVRERPARIRGNKKTLRDGTAVLTVVYELTNVPENYKNRYNGRSQFTYELIKTAPNISPILFEEPAHIQASSSFSESIEFDSDSGTDYYKRSVLHVSCSHMYTYGGRVSFIEASYRDKRAGGNAVVSDFTTLGTYPVSASLDLTSSFDLSGSNVPSHVYSLPVPTNLRRKGDLLGNKHYQFRLRFLNSAGEPAVDFRKGTGFEFSGRRTGSERPYHFSVTSSNFGLTGSALIIEEDDNILAGSVKSRGYQGYSASAAGGPTGFLLYSGSTDVTPTDGTHGGVGLELAGGPPISGSGSLRFSTKTGKLEVTGSFLTTGDGEFGGTISASAGSVGGWSIASSSLFHQRATHTMSLSGTNGTIDLFSGSAAFPQEQRHVVSIASDVEEDTGDALSRPGLYIQDGMIFLKRLSGSFPAGSKAGVSDFVQEGTRIKPGFLHMMISQSSTPQAGKAHYRMSPQSAMLKLRAINAGPTGSDGGHDEYQIVSSRQSREKEPGSHGMYSNTFHHMKLITKLNTSQSFSSSKHQSSIGLNIDHIAIPSYGNAPYTASTGLGSSKHNWAGESGKQYPLVVNAGGAMGSSSNSVHNYGVSRVNFANVDFRMNAQMSSALNPTGAGAPVRNTGYALPYFFHVNPYMSYIAMVASETSQWNQGVAQSYENLDPYSGSSRAFINIYGASTTGSTNQNTERMHQNILNIGGIYPGDEGLVDGTQIGQSGSVFLTVSSSGEVGMGSNIWNRGYRPTKALQVQGEISSSGNITSQATITAEQITSTDDITATDSVSVGEDIVFSTNGSLPQHLRWTQDNDQIYFDSHKIIIAIDDSDDYQFGPNTFASSNPVDITNTTDSTDASGDTGALRVEGGASIGKSVFIGNSLIQSSSYNQTPYLSSSNGNVAISGSGLANLIISGTLTFADQSTKPSASGSTIYNSGSDLYFGQRAGTGDFPIGPKTLHTYPCSFNDDMGVAEHGLPWGSTFENAIHYDETVGFLVPCATNVRHVMLRGQGFDQNLSSSPKITFRVRRMKPHMSASANIEGNWDIMETTVVNLSNRIDNFSKEPIYAIFSGSHCDPADIMAVTVQFSHDFTSGADEFYSSITVEHDYSSLPTLGFSTGSIPTGSAGFGVGNPN